MPGAATRSSAESKLIRKVCAICSGPSGEHKVSGGCFEFLWDTKMEAIVTKVKNWRIGRKSNCNRRSSNHRGDVGRSFGCHLGVHAGASWAIWWAILGAIWSAAPSSSRSSWCGEGARRLRTKGVRNWGLQGAGSPIRSAKLLCLSLPIPAGSAPRARP